MIEMKDTVRIAKTSSDAYGDKKIVLLTEVDALFLQNSSSVHSNHVDEVNSDAHVYLDIDNNIIKDLGYRIEGMYLISNPFGNIDDESWYKISRVVVGQRKLLDNDVDNVHAFLKKVRRLEVADEL